MTKAAELAKMGEVLTNSQIGGRRNIVINGGMQVAQRATSATNVFASNAYFTIDRMYMLGSTNGRLTMSQETDTPNGFANSLKLDCTTADTSIGSTEYGILAYHIEGQDLQQLKKGTSDAEKITVSFYVKGNANATYTCELKDSENNRQNSQEFNVTTSWNRVILTFDGDTTGALSNDTSGRLYIYFWLHAGSGYTSATHTDNVWHTADNQRVGDNATSILDSTDRTFFLTGLQMEVGSQATPFEHRSFGEELALCQRYCFDVNPASGASPNTPYIMSVAIYNDTLAISHVQFPTEMRTTPTTTLTGAAADFSIVEGNQTRVCTGFAANGLGAAGGGINWTVNAGGMTTGNAGNVYIESNKRAFFDAEI
jgi:hypothetical protein